MFMGSDTNGRHAKNPQNHSFSFYFNSDFENFIYKINIFSFHVEFNPAK